ncbi:MAG: thiamine diphosphokinase [bacterium]
MQPERVVIFVNGEIPDLQRARGMLLPGDFIIAADGGSRHLHAMGILPHLLVGDLDSIPASYLNEYRLLGIDIKQYPSAKDATDLELAFQHAASLQPASIVIAGATGARFDHTLANALLVSQPGYRDLEICLDDGTTKITLIRQSLQITGSAGDIVSLIPLSGAVSGITTTGLEYPLENEDLALGETRGVSNVMTGPDARVIIQAGMLLCIHTRMFSGGK